MNDIFCVYHVLNQICMICLTGQSDRGAKGENASQDENISSLYFAWQPMSLQGIPSQPCTNY